MERTADMAGLCKMLFLLFICCIISCTADGDSAGQILTFRHTCDASAAVAVADGLFIVADDENNVLRVYKTTDPNLPVFTYDLTRFLDIDPEHPEADIEAAAMVGDRVYWITSHGRNRKGKIRPNRYRFFATTVRIKNGNIAITPVGTPCRTLVHSLLKTESMRQLELDRAARLDSHDLTKKQQRILAPRRQGLNVEGLCASPNGKTLYIGLRNPRPDSKALVVALKNPAQVVEQKEPPLFGDPVLWDLKGLGIRSMEYSDFHKAYFIVAGPHDEKRSFFLYRWDGQENTQPALVRKIQIYADKFTPEALVSFKNSPAFLLLSDDGALVVDIANPSECMRGRLSLDGTCPQKFLTDTNKKSFRAVSLQP